MNTGKSSPLVGAALGPTMFKLAIPGIVGALLFSSLSVIEAYFLRTAGAEALASVVIVFPLIMLAAMFSAGAIGGAVSGRMARAMGAGDYTEASAVLLSAILISIVFGAAMCVLVLVYGPWIYALATDSNTILEAAGLYASIVFPAIPALWLVNMLCSVMRGAGDMVRPALVAAVLIIAYIIIASLIIPSSTQSLNETVRAAALAMDGSFLIAAVVAIYFTLYSKLNVRMDVTTFKWRTLNAILKQGLLASSQSIMTVLYAMVTTVLLGRFGTEWLAGFGIAVRLELLMVPIVFGLGASLIAIVGAYDGAGLRRQAISIAWKGIFINVIVVGAIGVFFAVFPGLWCETLGSDSKVISHCSQAVQIISPTFAFFALGLGCYFASQGLNTLAFPVLGSFIRLLLASSALLWVTSSSDISTVLIWIAFAVVSYGVIVAVGLKLGPWKIKPDNSM